MRRSVPTDTITTEPEHPELREQRVRGTRKYLRAREICYEVISPRKVRRGYTLEVLT